MKQEDFYQMLAYGMTYQAGSGDMMLIYPRHDKFPLPLPPFELPSSLRLWAVPFCLDSDGLVEGEWCSHFPGLSNGTRLPHAALG